MSGETTHGPTRDTLSDAQGTSGEAPAPRSSRSGRSARPARAVVGSVVVAFLGLSVLTFAGGAIGAEPASTATPQAACGPGGRPEPDIQGRFPKALFDDGSFVKGLSCNIEILGRFGSSGGYRVERYVDAAGHECAFYDSTLLFPANVREPDGPGVYVLDMTDPTKPVLTDTLTTPAMLSPHESFRLNAKRGLLAAGQGSPATEPGIVDVYDVSADCRTPVLKSSTPLGITGHESAFAPDGLTFYVTGTASPTLVALDLTDPAVPKPVWVSPGQGFHGMNISDDGKTLYAADASVGRRGLTVLDVTQVQARVPNPRVTEISHLTWPSVSIPQNADPITIKGKPYVIEVDEFNSKTLNGAPGYDPAALIGAGRIIDMSDPADPVIVSQLRLEVHEPSARSGESKADPGASSGTQGYAGHYCSVPTRVDPTIVACSYIASGLRVFDIRDPLKPVEVGYLNMPESGGGHAMSAPTFVPEREEVWWTDGSSGFFALKLQGVARMAGPGAVAAPPAAPPPAAPPAAPPTGPPPSLPSTGLPASQVLLAVTLGLIALAASRRVRRVTGRA